MNKVCYEDDISYLTISSLPFEHYISDYYHFSDFRDKLEVKDNDN